MSKAVKWLSLLLVLSLVLAGCANGGNGGNESGSNESGANQGGAAGSTEGSGEKIEITFINGFTGGDGGYMKKITDGFNRSQDKYVVKEMQEKDHYTKFKSGDYDLVMIRSSDLQTYKLDSLIQDIAPIMDKAGIKETDFHPAGVDLVKLDGAMYALPLDIHPLTMFYNKDLVAEAPTTYDQLVSLQKELQAKDPGLYAMGVPSSGLVEFYMMTIAGQNGINMASGNYLNFNQSEFADALLVFNRMIFKDKISPAGLGLDGEFQSFMKEAKDANASVQSAVALTGPWFYGAAKEKYADKLGVAPVPTLGGKPGAYGNSNTIAVPASVTDEQKLEGIAAYLKYMFTPENLINWADAGQAPVHKETMEMVTANQDKYPLPYANIQQFDTFIKAPQVYQFGEQMRFMNETVFSKIVTTENITKDEVMKLLEEATGKAQQIAAAQP